MIWILGEVLIELFENNWLLETLEEVANLLLLYANLVDVVVFVLLESHKLLVEVPFELEDNFLEELNLAALSLVAVQVVGLVEHLEDVLALKRGFEVIDRSLSLDDFPVNLLHALDVTRLALVGESRKSGLLIWVPLARLRSKLTLGDGEDGLEFATVALVIQVHVVHLVILLL